MFKKMILPISVAFVLIISAIVGSILILNNENKYGNNGGGDNPTTNIGSQNNGQNSTTPVHIHKFDQEPIYTVEGEIAYITYACSNGCEERSERKAVSNAVIATPTTVQDVLDGDINNKIVVLNEGVYEYLELRPSLANVQKISVDKNGGSEFGEPIYIRAGGNFRDIAEIVENQKTYNYLYETTFENITIVGVDGTVLRNRFDAVSGVVDYTNLRAEDPIRNLEYNETGWKHTVKLTIKNLKLLNLKFNGIGATINIAYSENDYSYYDRISIENCRFTTLYQERLVGSPAIRVDNAKNVDIVENIVVGHYYGIYTTNVFNLDCEKNTIKQTNSNAIVLQSGFSEEYLMGKINIVSNHIEDVYGQNNAGDRAILIKNGNHCTILIKDNTFVNATNSLSQVIKVFSLTNSLFSVINNNYYETLLSEGKAIDNITNSGLASFEIVVY